MVEQGANRVDKSLVLERFSASVASYDLNATAQQYIYQALERRLASLGRKAFGRVLEIGCGTGGFGRYIDERYEVGEWVLNDLHPAVCEAGRFTPRRGTAQYKIGDAEQIELGESYDLILSASALQWFHEPAYFIERMSRALAPGGALLLSTFGGDNLMEFRSLTGRGLTYPSLEELRKWLETHLEVKSIDEEHYPLHFSSPRDVLLHLKHTGVTASGDGAGFWTPTKLRRFGELYRSQFCDDAGLRLTYHPIYILAQRVL